MDRSNICVMYIIYVLAILFTCVYSLKLRALLSSQSIVTLLGTLVFAMCVQAQCFSS